MYILRCADGSYYVGSTNDLAARIERHSAGEGATWTARRRPVTLVYQECHRDQASAVKREQQIKRWSRAKKEALIAGYAEVLKKLSKRRDAQQRRKM